MGFPTMLGLLLTGREGRGTAGEPGKQSPFQVKISQLKQNVVIGPEKDTKLKTSIWLF